MSDFTIRSGGLNNAFGGEDEDNFAREMLEHHGVQIDNTRYEVPVIGKKCTYWGRGWRIGFIKPSWLWALIEANAWRGAKVMTYDSDTPSDPRPGCGVAGEDVVVACTTDPLLIWDGLCVHAAVLDAPVCVVFGDQKVDGLLWIAPERSVWRTSFEVDGWTGITEPGGTDWEDTKKGAELAWNIAWERVWEAN